MQRLSIPDWGAAFLNRDAHQLFVSDFQPTEIRISRTGLLMLCVLSTTITLKMAMNYEPIFKGNWPENSAKRWSLIRKFLSVWCFGEPDYCSEQRDQSAVFNLSLRGSTNGPISPSLSHWSDVIANYSGKELVIRDVNEVSDLSTHMDVPIGEFTVILMQGEGDVFWAVRSESLCDDDPQVFAFQDYASDSDPLLGTYPSVSIFALWYFCVYNNVPKNRVDVVEHDLRSNSREEIFHWFPHRLSVLPANSFCNSLDLLEGPSCVGILLENRLTFSLFSDPDQLALPSPLKMALEEAHQRRKELKLLLSGNSNKEKST